MPTSRARVRRGLVCLFAALSAAGASAQDTTVQATQPYYLVASLSRSEYTGDGGFVTCRCRSDKSQALRLGGGYRFGVSAVEAWFIDFGRASFAADSMGPATTARVRAAALGVAWTARLGASFEANWRIGAASVHTGSSDLPSTRSVRPIFGASLGLRLTESLLGELSFDITHAKDGAGSPIDATALGFGLRYRF